MNISDMKDLLVSLWGNQPNETNTPFERVHQAVAHKATDRVPFDYFAVPELTNRLCSLFSLESGEDLLQLLGCDCRRLAADYLGRQEVNADGTFYNTWGAHRKWVSNEVCTYDEIAGFVLENATTVGQVRDYERWPRFDLWDWQGLNRKIALLEQRTQYYYRVHIGGIFETAWSLFGLEKFLMDLYLEPEIPCAIMDCCTDILVECVHGIRDVLGDRISMIATYDDVASQQSLLMSPDMWRTHVLPRHVRLNNEIKRCGYSTFYHSCGAVSPLIGDFITDMQVDMLDPLQPRATGMDLPMIKMKWGDEIAFHGGVDLQYTMPFGTTEEVTQEVENLCRVMGANGGYICAGAHHFQADTPWTNIAAMYSCRR